MKDKLNDNTLTEEIKPRHNSLRNKIKRQANAIVKIRESYSPHSKFIRGIDAAASEFNARPEVFAQVFRYLKEHKLKDKYSHLKEELAENKLSATFHAGEDFYDIIDGLRSIDEAIKFLNLSQGDRIGHALALGVDVLDYFNFKGRKLMLPKEMLLDNIVWILAKVRKYNINEFTNECQRLKELSCALFQEIYSDALSKESNINGYHFTHETYYNAWKLRGDDPLIYLDINKNLKDIPNMNDWDKFRINSHYPIDSNTRNCKVTQYLYQQYHFNSEVKKTGRSIKQFNISEAYVNLVIRIQKEFQNSIKHKNLGIECNPTSNYLIGCFDKYVKHPIINFYNLDLETDRERISNCPQLCVSINTDDQGVFGTSLENEYALMAIALEKEKDQNGNLKYSHDLIYKWLDEIRQMGIKQSFMEIM